MEGYSDLVLTKQNYSRKSGPNLTEDSTVFEMCMDL